MSDIQKEIRNIWRHIGRLESKQGVMDSDLRRMERRRTEIAIRDILNDYISESIIINEINEKLNIIFKK